MAKKKITPTDLELNDEQVSQNPYIRGDATRNTCNGPLPQACDTTTTDPSFNTCTTADLDKCPPTDGCGTSYCKTTTCPTGVTCIHTFSDIEACCPTSALDYCITETCKTIETRDYCLESEVTCQATIEPCLITQDPCPETSICAHPMSLDFDCEVDPTNI